MKKTIIALLMIACLAGSVIAPLGAKPKKIVIGLSFTSLDYNYWRNECEAMQRLAREADAEVMVKNANHDTRLQNEQISDLVKKGANVIVVLAGDGKAVVREVEKAVAKGVPVIAYDRLIPSPKLAAYVSFDQVEVGRQQAAGILKVRPEGNFVLLGGAPDDKNAHLFRQGQMEVLKPLIDRGQIKIVADEWVSMWQSDTAFTIMKKILTVKKNRIDAVVASNDGTALGAIAALKAQGLAGKVPVSGQNATAEGCNSIARGELTMTLFKDVKLMPPAAMDLALRLARRQPVTGLVKRSLAGLTLDKKLKGNVNCLFLPLVNVDRDNLYDLVVKSGFRSHDDVYRNVPASDRLPRPDGEKPTTEETEKEPPTTDHGSLPQNKVEAIKIGLSLCNYSSERWFVEEKEMRRLGEVAGAQTMSQFAHDDPFTQNDQINNLILQGADVIIIAAADGESSGWAVEQAAAKGVPVIAYDRFIPSPKIAAWISFDYREIGRLQAEGMLRAVPRGRYILLGGSPTDPVAWLLHEGQMEILKPRIDQGDIRIVADEWIDNWSTETATHKTLILIDRLKNGVDAVLASNDSTALGVRDALGKFGLAGKIAVSGMDATLEACQAVARGEITFTVLKDIRRLPATAVETALKLARGEEVPGLETRSIAEIKHDREAQGTVSCLFLPLVMVDRDNLYREIVAPGLLDYDNVYRDVPENKRPPRP